MLPSRKNGSHTEGMSPNWYSAKYPAPAKPAHASAMTGIRWLQAAGL
jgi:hypothetical protein